MVKILIQIKNIKKNQIQLKTIITKIKNILQGIWSGLDDTEGQISELEDKVIEIIKVEHKKEKCILKN